jgi:hypothetical protein
MILPVLLLLYNNELYCRDLLPKVMDTIKTTAFQHGMSPRFYIYDNSTDFTPACLARLVEGGNYDMVVRSEQLPSHIPKGGGPRSTERCSRIAACRNMLLEMANDDLYAATVTLVIDSDIEFGTETLSKLITTVLETPSIAMATACTVEDFNMTHYYDTYAYVQEGIDVTPEGNLCPLQGCTQCNSSVKQAAFEAGFKYFDIGTESCVDVKSAFAGMAVVRTAAIEGVVWRSENDLCEHVFFCEAIRDKGYRVVLVLDALAVRHNSYNAARAAGHSAYVGQINNNTEVLMVVVVVAVLVVLIAAATIAVRGRVLL